jgi:hypothetical protein
VLYKSNILIIIVLTLTDEVLSLNVYHTFIIVLTFTDEVLSLNVYPTFIIVLTLTDEVLSLNVYHTFTQCVQNNELLTTFRFSKF